MVYSKPRSYRRNYFRKPFRRYYRKTYAKRNTAITRKTNIRKDIHFFKRGSNAFNEIVGNAAYGPGIGYTAAYTFSLDQVRNYAELVALFDRYKINHVQLKFFLRVDPSSQTAGTAYYPRMWWLPDYDDNTPNTIDQMREHSKVKTAILRPNRPVVVNIKPCPLTLLYNGATSGYSPQWGKWLDAGYNVPHYCLKWAIDQLDNTNYKIAIEATYWLSFKDTR